MWTKEERDEIAPTALTDIRPYAGTGRKLYFLHMGAIYEVTVAPITNPNEENYIFMISSLDNFSNVSFTAAQASLIPEIGGYWGDGVMFFDNLNDAMAVGQHPNYPSKRPARSMLRYLKSSSAFSGNSSLPLRANVNISR